MKRLTLSLAAIGLVVACSQANDGTQAQVTSGSTPRLHPTQAACVTYEMTGQMQSGTTTRCHRDWAYEQYEIQNVSIGFAGMSQTQNSHTITIGDTIYNIDVAAGTGTQTTNPMYDGMVAALQNSSSEDMTAAFFAQMGMSATGQTKTIAGESCAVYSSQMMGTVCMTDGGLMLEQSMMGMGQIATSISIGDGGDDANYTLYQNVTLTQGPDLSNGLQGLINP